MKRPLPVRPRYTYAYVTAESASRSQPRLYRDCRAIGSGNWDQLNLRMLADLNRNAVEQYEGFAAHAGVLGVNGRAIALPADSEGGKSTLTAAAVMTGFEYASDESLCLDFKSGEVTPYPKPITLSAQSCRLLSLGHDTTSEDTTEFPFTANQLNGSASSGTMKLTDVVFHEYGYSKPSLTLLTGSEIVAGLLRLSFNHYKNPGDSFRLITEIARGASAWRLTYGDPVEGAEVLWRELS